LLFVYLGWSITGSMQYDRELHTATRLANGQVLVTGGKNTLGEILNTTELYDPTTETWTSTGNMNSIRVYHTATLLSSGKVLVTGGQINSSAYLNTAELYDPSTGIWSSAGTMNSSRAGHAASLLTNGKVLITGGYTATTMNIYLNTAELYDPSTGLWTNTGSMNDIRCLHTATVLANRQVLVAGGGNSIVHFRAVLNATMYHQVHGLTLVV